MTQEDLSRLCYKQTCRLVLQEGMSYRVTRRHADLCHRKTCLLVSQEGMSSCYARGHCFLRQKMTCLLVTQEDMWSFAKRRRVFFASLPGSICPIARPPSLPDWPGPASQINRLAQSGHLPDCPEKVCQFCAIVCFARLARWALPDCRPIVIRRPGRGSVAFVRTIGSEVCAQNFEQALEDGRF